MENGYAFHWEPYSLHPTLTTANGTIVYLTSRDCCPYLDDYEADYVSPNSAAAAAADTSVVWDTKGPCFDDEFPWDSDDDYQFAPTAKPAATATNVQAFPSHDGTTRGQSSPPLVGHDWG